MSAAVTFEQVSKTWDATTALHPTDLVLPAGQFSVLLGPSGCDKTTTLRLMAGLETATTGSIAIFDRDVTRAPPSERGVSMVFQSYALFPHLSVAENVVFGLRVRKVSKADIATRLERALKLLGLERYASRRPSQLSGGQQQRVALARALVADARLCLMDEPLSNLDAQLRQEMRHELRTLQQELELTVVYVTHDQTEAMSMADQVVLLREGRVEQVATPFDIYRTPRTQFAAQFIGSSRMNMLRIERGCVAGSEIRVNAPAEAVYLGLRPEDIRLDGPIMLALAKAEFMGADLLLSARAGDQLIGVRAEGKRAMDDLSIVNLGWDDAAQHWFDVNGMRV